ncbi:hypothetical protein JCM3774_001565 [Rhodotorula dairenensis]
MRSPVTMHLNVQTYAQAGPSRPVTFALPPSPRLREDGLLATGPGTTPPVTPPAFDRSNPFGASAAASPSGASFLSRLSRKLSVGKSSLSRRASKGSRREPEPELASPQMARGVSFAAPSTPNPIAPCECIEPSTKAAPRERRAPTGLGLRRSLRVGHASALRRAKSEGNAPRHPRAVEGEEPDSAVPLQRRATGGGHAPSLGREVRPATAEVHSNLGSYFWSDSLGVCWDGRERVHPDLLFAVQPYTSDADYIPVPQAQQHSDARVVYASTLSSFPPRPPLRPRSPELSPAMQIVADYRAQHGTLTPSLRSYELVGPAEGEATVTAPTLRPPSPVPEKLRLAIDAAFASGPRTDSPVSTRSSTSQDARNRFAYASPGGHTSPGGGDGTEDGHRADSHAESDTSVEDDYASEVPTSASPAAQTKSGLSRQEASVRPA